MSNNTGKNIIWHVKQDDELVHISSICRFINREFEKGSMQLSYSEEYLNWKIKETKGYLSFATDEELNIYGLVTISLKRAVYNGKNITIGEIGDTYTDYNAIRNGRPKTNLDETNTKNSFINKSIFGRLAHDVITRAFADGVDLIYGTPNSKAAPGWTKRLDFSLLGKPKVFCYTKPTLKYYIGNSFFSDLLEQTYLTLYLLLKNKKPHVENVKPEVDRTNELWSISKSKFDLTLCRNYAYWENRYINNPDNKYEFYSIKNNAADDRYLGIVVCRYFPDSELLVFAEWMFADDSAINPSITKILKLLIKKHSPKKISVWLNEHIYEATKLSSLLFFQTSNIPIILKSETQTYIPPSKVFEFYLGTSDNV